MGKHYFYVEFVQTAEYDYTQHDDYYKNHEPGKHNHCNLEITVNGEVGTPVTTHAGHPSSGVGARDQWMFIDQGILMKVDTYTHQAANEIGLWNAIAPIHRPYFAPILSAGWVQHEYKMCNKWSESGWILQPYIPGLIDNPDQMGDFEHMASSLARWYHFGGADWDYRQWKIHPQTRMPFIHDYGFAASYYEEGLPHMEDIAMERRF